MKSGLHPTEEPLAHLRLVLVNSDDVLRDVEVGRFITLVQHHKEQVETAHDRRADLLPHNLWRRQRGGGGEGKGRKKAKG